MAVDPLLATGYAVAVMMGVGALLFGARTAAILRRPPTGEAGRELVFLNGRALVPPLALIATALLVEWGEWIASALKGAELLMLPELTFLLNIVQSAILFVAAVMSYRVLVPYTRARRARQTRLTLDRLAARITLLKGRR